MVCTRPAGAAGCGHWLGGPGAAHWLCAISSLGLGAMGLWHMTSDEVFLTVKVHWVQQAEAVQHPGYLLSPRLEHVPEAHWSNPGQGNGPYWVKAGMAETGAAI